ncbi:MAG: YceI family protein [Cyclobacteriaceae bacterium]|nr:YceI family protein [Cyclobacteriaceae bacterium]
MKNSIQFLFASLLSMSVMFVMVGCGGDPDPVTVYYNITGNVTYPDFSGASAPADGAVIYLAASAAATTAYDYRTVADASGNYSFEGLEAGDYFMFVNYNSANTNNGRISGISFDSGEGALFAVTDASVTKDVALVAISQDVQFDVDITPTTGTWAFDANHSVVSFNFPYHDDNATFSGTFNSIPSLLIKFNAADLAASTIEASIDLLSVNTRSRGGRDSHFDATANSWYYGCNAASLGVQVDTVNNMMPIETSRYATFKSTSIEAYGDGFIAKGDFTLKGQTHQEVLFFRFINGYEGTSRSGAPTRYSSFDGRLEFNALADYNIQSSAVGSSKVIVDVAIQVNKAL